MGDRQWWDRKGQKLVARTWTDVRDWWANYIPVIDPPGSPPADVVGNLPSVGKVLKNVQDDAPWEEDEEVGGLRAGVLAESLFTLHKAANVLGAAQVHVGKGLCSWSLSSAYHAAFFSAKAVLGLLGVTVIETNNRTYLIDVWPPPKKKKNLINAPSNTLFQLTHRVEHRQIWAWFQRMLRVTTVDEVTWPKKCVEGITDLDINDFARQRNTLHYATIEWPFQDLHQCVVMEQFGRHPAGLADGDAVSDPDNEDFSIALGLVTLRMAYQMVRDIAVHSEVIKVEGQLLEGWLQGECNQLYQAAYPAQA